MGGDFAVHFSDFYSYFFTSEGVYQAIKCNKEGSSHARTANGWADSIIQVKTR